ncbi:MAG: hypothetical protein FWF24_01040 [Alphaproteobacteria bacterium]|nr:hypothetical protein [Alphaproteobacteria bacterium]
MKAYQFLSQKLQKFTLVEFAMVEWIYIIFGVLVASLYRPLLVVSGWFYLFVTLIAAAPLLIYFLNFEGSLIQRARQYIAGNNPSNQVLTLLSCAFFGIAATAFFPILTRCDWWIYAGLMILLFIKPFTHLFLRD